MENFYKTLWLFRFLDSMNLPPEIRRYLDSEVALLLDKVKKGSRLADFGCGLGRHLGLLAPRLNYGLGFDLIPEYINYAKREFPFPNLGFIVSDALESGIKSNVFDYVICMNNTLGNTEEPRRVIEEMKRVVSPDGRIIVGVYSGESIEARKEWYRKTGLVGITEVKGGIMAKDPETQQLFESRHFSEGQLRSLFGACNISSIAGMGYFVEVSR